MGSILTRWSTVDRRSSNSVKWAAAKEFLAPDEQHPDMLPMWVADMDFRAPPVVLDALRDALGHGVLGYPKGATPAYVAAVTAWQRRRFGWEVSPEWVVQTPGVIASIGTAIQAFSHPGDSILIQPPVYGHFTLSAQANGRRLAHAPLAFDGERYRFDARTFEQAILPNTKLFILCSPHNPTGNVWSEDDLRAMGEICLRHGVLVIADEIHQDFVLDRTKRHLPFASLGEDFRRNSITCTAPSKTFNLSGLQSANAFIPDSRLRDEFKRQLVRNGVELPNVLGMVAAEAAYRHGEPWLEAMLDYVRDNQAYFASEIHRRVPGLRVLPAESLYLAWMDCRGLGMPAGDLNRLLLTQAKLWLNMGRKFGVEGDGFIRVNLGCPRATVSEALKRLASVLAPRG